MAFSRATLAHLPYVNLFPTYAPPEQLGTPSYYDHAEDFLNTVTPRIVSYDHYALLEGDRLRPDYFENPALVRAASRRHGVPFWFSLQLIPEPGWRELTEHELRWQVYTSLAYGAKGIWHFTLWTVPPWYARPPPGSGRLRPAGEADPFFRSFRDVFEISRATGAEERVEPRNIDPPALRVNLRPGGGRLFRLERGRPRYAQPFVLKAAPVYAGGNTRRWGTDGDGLTLAVEYHTGDVPPGGRRLGGTSPVMSVTGDPLAVRWFKDADRRDYLPLFNPDPRFTATARLSIRGPLKGVYAVDSPEEAGRAVPPLEDGSPAILAVDLAPRSESLYRVDRDLPWASLPPVLTRFPLLFGVVVPRSCGLRCAFGGSVRSGSNRTRRRMLPAGSHALFPAQCGVLLRPPPRASRTHKGIFPVEFGGDRCGLRFQAVMTHLPTVRARSGRYRLHEWLGRT